MRSFLQKVSYLLSPREKRMGMLLLGAMVVGAVLEVAGVGAIPAFVALLSSPERILRFAAVRRTFAAVGASSPQQQILWAAAALAVLFTIKNAFLSLMAYAQARYIYSRQVALGNRLFRAYLRSPYAFHLQRNSAQLLHNLENEAVRVANDVYLSVLRMITEVLVLLAILILLIVIEPLMSIGMVLLLGSSSLAFLGAIRRRIGKYSGEEHTWRTEMIRAVHQSLGGLKDVKVLGREDYFLRSFDENAVKYTRAGAFKTTIYELPRQFLEVIAVFAMLAVAAVFIYQQRPMTTIVPVLTLLALAAVRLLPSTNRLVNSGVSFRWGIPALRIIYADLKELEGEQGRKSLSNVAPLTFHHSIEFERVRFRYPEAASDALKSISFSIPRGAAVALVGPSGSGKTTCADLLLGLLEPTCGNISVDGRDIRENLASWQRLIGYIPQHIYLVDDSIRRNVAFGIADGEIDDARVWRAIDASQLRDLVEALPAGLDTPVGERGVRLSGGQRQRIGIARALYHDPPVLVMDEATSALDNGTESLIMETLEQLRGTRTMVAIAHRHTTVERFDTVLLIRDGLLVAQGAYQEILAPTV